MKSTISGLREVNGVSVLALDGLWNSISGVPAEEKMSVALQYAGCEFYDNDYNYVAQPSIALIGLGGEPITREDVTDQEITNNIDTMLKGSRKIMSWSAAFSYLNSGEKDLDTLYETATRLGHFSIAHTIQLNMVLAGISEGAELEVNLQRDLLHISKVTNTRTSIQTNPPIVVRDMSHIPHLQELRSVTSSVISSLLSESPSMDEYEVINGYNSVNKATIIMLSGTLNNFRKFVQLRDDTGKEKEVRNIADYIRNQLGLLWPEIIK